ncbi:TonB-dependent receptor [Phenylobacterium sp. LjRoot225]|uniref:TonB-dependent receptor n=1 Tax=Phenylobacterium sp. LjRoot225 TaxID=3342285 RepID=UPI003ED0F015
MTYRAAAALAGASLFALGSAAQAQTASVATAESDPVAARANPASAVLGEIIVTAQKREQRLQDVPVSITALTATALAANRIQNVGDLNAIAPNLTVRETSGGAGIPGITMRGALSYGVGPGADREVGFYVDGVYIGHAQGSIFDLADIERIEVLRGPQGTLFGRNATAGAISIVTKNPKGEFALNQEVTVGNYDQFRSKTRIDFPALGPLSAALTYSHSERRGDVRNLGAGTVWDYSAAGKGLRTSPKWLGSQNTESVAAAVKYEPTDTLKFTYKFDWTDAHNTPLAIGFPGFGPPVDGGLVATIHALQPDPSILTPITTKRPKAVNNGFTTAADLRVYGHNLTADWQIADGVGVKNVVAYRKVRDFATQELGALGGEVVPAALAGVFQVPAGTPFTVYGNASEFRHEQISDELQLNVDHKWATVTAGLLYYHQKQASGGPLGLSNQFLFTPTPGHVLSCADPATCQGPNPTKGTSKAAYIQVEGHLTSQLDLIGGYRVTRDSKSGRSPFGSFDVKETNSSYLLGANYRPTDEILLYGKYSTAFMSGGGNTGRFFPNLLTYAPEKAGSWEGGVKSDWFDRRLRLNLSLFTVKYTDLQFIIGGIFCGDGVSGVCVFTAGDARAKGAELEVTAVPVDRLTLSAGVGYTDFKYLNLSPIATAATGFFSKTYRPKWTTNLSAQYDTEPLFDDAHLSFRVDANFRSSSLLAADAPPQFQPIVTIPSIWIVNGRVALADLNIAGHTGEIALWGKNLTNDKHMAMSSSFTFMYPTTYERARTFGVDLKFDW